MKRSSSKEWKKKILGRSILLVALLIILFPGCKKSSDSSNALILGEWTITIGDIVLSGTFDEDGILSLSNGETGPYNFNSQTRVVVVRSIIVEGTRLKLLEAPVTQNAIGEAGVRDLDSGNMTGMGWSAVR